MNFNYLGIDVLYYDRNTEEEVRIEANKAARISGYLRDIIWRNTYMSVKSIVRIYKA